MMQFPRMFAIMVERLFLDKHNVNVIRICNQFLSSVNLQKANYMSFLGVECLQ
jgi:hypothetical protein